MKRDGKNWKSTSKSTSKTPQQFIKQKKGPSKKVTENNVNKTLKRWVSSSSSITNEQKEAEEAEEEAVEEEEVEEEEEQKGQKKDNQLRFKWNNPPPLC